MDIRIAGVVRESIVDGPGLRFTVFTQGCVHNCEGCHNPKTHNINGGYLTTTEKILSEYSKNPFLKGITLSGGEPLLQISPCLSIAKEICGMGGDIVLYSGYTYEQIIKMAETSSDLQELLCYVAILVDGKFEISEKDLSLRFAGSKNQRVIDVPKTLESGTVVLYEEG